MKVILSCLVALATTWFVSSEKLQVHIVGHTHDDPGWLKTADQYYSGSNSSIYVASVQYIFDSVMTELSKHKDRKFTFCEISFFERWFHEQDAETKALVRKFVNSGQLDFVNGGWVMHDEASAHFVSMIDQTTLGHDFLKTELNFTPKVGWQIDPFGHSRTHAWLSSEVGFDALFFGRIDYQDHNKRMAERTMEMVWKGSTSQPDAEVFTGVFQDGNYGPPSGYCFDTSCGYCRSDPVVDDPLLETYNLDAKVQNFIQAILEEKSHSVGNNIMLKMGSDFAWDNAHTWFKSIDKLIAAVNADERFNLFYSTPTNYMRAKADEDITWTSKSDDFFPYSDCEHCFWTGYFTSRPTLKYQERVSASYLQVLKQLTALPSFSRPEEAVTAKDAVFRLTAAVGLVNHHDAITGTSKQHVADDYNKIISAALTEAEQVAAASVSLAVAGPHLAVCRLSNESFCEQTQALKDGDDALVIVYNPLPRTRSQQVSVFLSDEAVSGGASRVSVYALDLPADSPFGKKITADLVPTAPGSPNPSAAPWTLLFTASNIAQLSTSRYLIRLDSATPPTATLYRADAPKGPELDLVISNDLLSVTFSRSTGLMKSITRRDLNISAEVSNDIRSYKSFGSPTNADSLEVSVPPVDTRDPHLKNIKPGDYAVGSVSSQRSGAYIFRPSQPDEVPSSVCDANEPVQLEVVRGRGVVEVRQRFSSWVSQVVRLRDGSNAVELEYSVGPVPVDGVTGREVVSRFDSSLDNGDTGSNVIYTDSNGREFLERKFNYRPTWDMEVFEPVAGNLYPITTAMYIRDENAGLQLSVLPDRAQAGGSLAKGQMELMVHRRLTQDDARGVDEPLDETTGGISPYPSWTRSGDGITVTGKHFLLLSKLNSGVREVRDLMDELFAPVAPFIASGKADSRSLAPLLTRQAGLGIELPSNVQLISLQRTSPSTILVRIGHKFAVGEDEELSREVEVDLAALLAPFEPTSAVELNLSANQDKAVQERDKIRWKSSASSKSTPKRSLRQSSDDLSVSLQPMEIRTFSVKVNK